MVNALPQDPVGAFSDIVYFFIAAAEASSFSIRARSLAASSRAPLTTASGALAIKP